jgi:hypothetical protein
VNKLVLPAALAAAALVVPLAPTAPASAASPSLVAKVAMAKAVRKLDKYAASHAGGVPTDAQGTKLVAKKAPKGVTFTYASVLGATPGYCASAGTAAMGSRRWFHDSWTGKTWRTTAAAAAKAGGACGAVASQPDPGDAKAEMKAAINDAWDVSDAIDEYYDGDDVDALPTLVDDAWLGGQGLTLTPGSHVRGYEVIGEDLDSYRFCVVRDSGAWATYDDDEVDVVGSGTSGAACTY